jgi:putative transposase
MLISYTYKLDPSGNQSATMENHVEMLRLQYNFRIRERTEAYEQASRPILGDYCNIETQAECCPLACSVSKQALYGDLWTVEKKTGLAKKRGALAQQDADLVNLKRERPWYAQIQHHVLQQMLRRINDGFQRFFQGKAGYPKQKRRGKFRSFSYPPGDVRFQGNRVRLPGIGWMCFFQSRPFPDGFTVRSVTVRRKSDGWFISVRLQDDSVPATITSNEVKTAIGVDLGIAKLASINTGETIPNPRFGQKSERRRKLLHRRASRKQKGSRKRCKAYQSLARLETRVANQRADYQWKQAKHLCDMSDLIIFEDLNIKGMCARCKPKKDELTGRYIENGQAAKSGLNKAILVIST